MVGAGEGTTVAAAAFLLPFCEHSIFVTLAPPEVVVIHHANPNRFWITRQSS